VDNSMTVVRVADGWNCELRENGLRVRIHLVDENGALTATEVTVSSAASQGLAASALSRAPYAKWIRAAKDEASRQRPGGRLKRVSDLHLTPFLEDGRGKARRSDRDYANLAHLYVLRGESSRSLARDLATRHGGSIQTWRNRLTKAKRFTCLTETFGEKGDVREIRVLTDEAMRLVYGDNYVSRFEDEAVKDRELEGATRFIRIHETPQTSAERVAAKIELNRYGTAVIARRLEAAHRIVETYGQER
jgi:hypothetical protein